jgi:hypothetical protein
MTYTLIAYLVILFSVVIAQKINKRRLTKMELADYKRATFQDRWWLYAVIFLWVILINVFRSAGFVFIPAVIFFIAWSILIEWRLSQTNLPKSFLQVDRIISIILLVLGGSLLLFAYFSD